jgi:YidC/Oxa1 family membrane protein insertase
LEKRTILAIVLCLAIWFIWQALFLKPPEHQPAVEDTTAPVQAQAEEKPAQAPAENRPEEKTAVLENDLLAVTFSTRGATPSSIEIKKFRARDVNRGIQKNLENLVSTSDEKQRPFRLDFKTAPAQPAFPAYTDWRLVRQATEQLEFSINLPELGLEISKSYRLLDPPYTLELTVSITNTGSSSSESQLIVENHGKILQGVSSGCFNPPVTPRSAKCFAGGTIYQASKNADSQTAQPQVNWTAVDEQYFISAIIPQQLEQAACRVEGFEDRVTASLVLPQESISPGGQKEYRFLLYLGPKQVELLEKVTGGAGNQDRPAGLNKAVDYGWLAVLCYPMLWALKFFYRGIHNYGIAIIILTIIIKILLQPLTNKSMKSMKEMSKIKPLMDQIREKYKDDKERLNQEIMNLYKTHKINPLGGCFPMLLQMPIWIALYRMLYSSVELYQAPFIPGWIDDLSWRDPWFIMPVLLGVTMFVQQKITPSTMDSQQAKMMLYIMPVFFTFIMLYLPSGLVLYIFVSSLLSIGQQIWMNRKSAEGKA